MKKITIIFSVLILLFSVGVSAQVTQDWVAIFDGTLNGNDRAEDVEVDSAGNVYIAGNSANTGTGGDMTTIKYDSAGNQLWIATFDGTLSLGPDSANALEVDGAGNVYITGFSRNTGTGNDITTIKYDNLGNQLWVAIFDGTANDGDQASDVEVDSAGNVYITGSSRNTGTGGDMTTIKYDSLGNQLWVAIFDGTLSIFDGANEVEVDSAGNVYITGLSQNTGTSCDMATIKYDSAGNQLWVATFDGTLSSCDSADDLEIDSGGNAYITGFVSNTGTSGDMTTIKYDSLGNQVWVATFDGTASSFDRARDVEVDSAGNVYIAGTSENTGTGGDMTAVKYDSAGNQLWVATLDGTASSFDNGNDLEVDGAGNVYLTGQSSNTGTGNDMTAVKFDSLGNQVWVQTFDGTQSFGFDRANDLELDGAGNVYITGRSVNTGTSLDMTTIKYSQFTLVDRDDNVDLPSGGTGLISSGGSVNGNVFGDATTTLVLGTDASIDGNVGVGTVVFNDGASMNGNLEGVQSVQVSGDASILGNIDVADLTVSAGATLTVSGNLLFSGTLTLEAGATLSVAGNVECTGGATAVVDPTATVLIAGSNLCSVL